MQPRYFKKKFTVLSILEVTLDFYQGPGSFLLDGLMTNQ